MDNETGGIVKIILTVVTVIGLCVGGGLWGCPTYNVYSSRMAGEAELAQATYTRRTKVLEAQAELDSSKLLAQKAAVDAQGVANANRIIAADLGGPQGYLRFLYIQMLEKSKEKQIIYLPTEAGMPLLEAGKRP